MVKHFLDYLNYNPQLGIISAIGSYVIAINSLTLTDESLKLLATVSSLAGCFVGCATALSWIIRVIFWIKSFINKPKNHDTNN